MEFPNLFAPIKINELELSNRIVMTAMHLGYTPEGEVTDRLIHFYVERAKGGTGLIVVGGCPIDEYGGMSNMICLYDDRFLPGLKRLTDEVKAHGAKIAAQLYQAGRYTHSAMIGGRKPFSASAVRSRLTGETPRALELEEIPSVQEKFAEAAVRARQAGFDAVEILGSAGYLISQFLSPVTNQREDHYGGSLENRMRFGLEVVARVRKAVGPRYPVLMRLAGNDFMEGGNTNREARLFAVQLEKAGVDLFNITGGWHETRIPQLTMSVPRGAYVYLAQGIKSVVSVPVVASNRINDPRLAEEVIRKGQADLVTVARGLIADPAFGRKAREGTPQLISHCVACNQGCFDSIFDLRPVGCLVNPMAGKESEWRVEPAARPKKVLIVGGGAAGMKAACTAAERGHRVTLVERENRLGGQLLLNAAIPGREEMVTAATDLMRQLEASSVEVLLGREADHHFLNAFSPEVVVVATGAKPILPEIEGHLGKNVVQAWDVLAGKASVGNRVAIVGGNAVGLETALFLANQGTLSPDVLHFLVAHRAEAPETLFDLVNKGNKEIVVVEMLKRAGKDIGQSTRWTVMAELKRLGVNILTATKAVRVAPDGLAVETEGGSDFIPADTIIMAVGSRPEKDLLSGLESPDLEIHVIGDAKEPRKALDAIREGFLAGMKI
jgi:2,4-dienoyl-CoA reductase (NADPH2)